MLNRFGPIVSTHDVRTQDNEIAPGVRVRICNIPTIVRTGGHEAGVREYYTVQTARQLEALNELARMRMASGESDIRLEFGDDASEAREALRARRLAGREHGRRRYGRRLAAIPRFGTADYYYERLLPVAPLGVAKGQDRPG